MNPIPPKLARTIIDVYGTIGVDWLKRLPALIAECSTRWLLRIHPPFDNLSYNYVAPASRPDGTEAVLKLGVPNSELATEIESLYIFDGQGIVQLIDADASIGALLLERLKPGASVLTTTDDEQATRIAARVMRQLWKPVPKKHSFPTIAKWAKGFERLRKQFDDGPGPLPTYLVDTAERIYAEYIASSAEPVLLHGDLHHENILSAERQPWLALDPKGVVGEPAYDVGAWLRNPMPQLLSAPNPGRVLARRVDQFAEEFGFDRARIIGWGMAQAVLSAWWNFEGEGRGWEPAIACAELMAKMK